MSVKKDDWAALREEAASLSKLLETPHSFEDLSGRDMVDRRTVRINYRFSGQSYGIGIGGVMTTDPGRIFVVVFDNSDGGTGKPCINWPSKDFELIEKRLLKKWRVIKVIDHPFDYQNSTEVIVK